MGRCRPCCTWPMELELAISEAQTFDKQEATA